MNMIGKSEIESLVQLQKGPSVSIYMPVSRIGEQQDAIRYKNLLSGIEKKLVDQGVRKPEARTLLEAEYTFAREPENWLHLGADGLAVFLSDNTRLRYHLPLSFTELATVGRRFHIKPLIPLLASEEFLVLGLSKKRIRLFHGDRYTIREIELPEGTPKSMAEALQYDDPQSQLQYHATSTGGGQRPTYHGQGVGIDDEKSNLERYFQAVDSGLFPLLEDKEFPIVLAGVEELHGIFQRITSSHTLLPGGITGNANDLSTAEFHRRAWQIAREYFAEGEREVVRNFRDSLAGSRAVNDLRSVLAAAFDGRVASLFVAGDEHVWGTFDSAKRQAVLMDKNDENAIDLLDQAVAWTFCRKGSVYVRKRQDMPADTPICALLRY